MESKRKRLSLSNSADRKVKKRKEDKESQKSMLGEEKNENMTKTMKVAESCSIEKSMKRPLAGPIIKCLRKQQQEEARDVTCPICCCKVLFKNINQHLDSGCQDQTQRSIKTSSSIQLGCKNQIGFKKNNYVSNGKDKAIISVNCKSAVPAKKSQESGKSSGNNISSDLLNMTEFCFDNDNPKSDSKSVGCAAFSSENKKSNVKKAEPSNDEAVSSNPCDSNDGQFRSNKRCLQSDNGELEQDNVQIYLGDNCVRLESQLKETQNDETLTSPGYMSYLENFQFVMKSVLLREDDKELFNDSDNRVIKSFHELSNKSKLLYVRLLQRKFRWFRICNIKYQNISNNLQPYFDELIKAGFLLTEEELDELTEIFKLLSVSEVQILAKSMHLQTKVQSKKNLINAFMEQSKTQRSLFATNGDRILKSIGKRAKSLLGSCVKLAPEPRNVFSRVILLFTLNLCGDDDDDYGAQLSSIFLTNIGKIVYPSYQTSRQTAIFQDRDDVICYESANQDLCCIDYAIERKEFDDAIKVYSKVHELYLESQRKLRDSDPRLIHVVKLPVQLRCFTSTWLYVKMCSRGVELLQRSREYDKAVELLRLLLEQNEFCPNHRGWWWERLALNLDQHLKKPEEALVVVREALNDARVKTGHRFALEERAKKICLVKRHATLRKYLTEIKFTELRKPNIETISGKRLEHEPVFVVSEVNKDGSKDSEVISYCGVEEMALRHYRRQGYNEGIHGEGATFSTLFTLLMWDVIFCDSVPDVFRTTFQAAPLDIYSENFYANRKEIIDERLKEIENASVETLTEWIETKWLEEEGKTCVGVKWELFSGVQQVASLVRCLGNRVIAGICGRFAKDYRHTRSGLPDLVVWNCSNLKYKIVEVKGPNDRLSDKQHIWLDALVRLGVDAEVLYVKASGGRKL